MPAFVGSETKIDMHNQIYAMEKLVVGDHHLDVNTGIDLWSNWRDFASRSNEQLESTCRGSVGVLAAARIETIFGLNIPIVANNREKGLFCAQLDVSLFSQKRNFQTLIQIFKLSFKFSY